MGIQGSFLAKTLLPIVSTFLAEYLPIWDGLSNVDTILGLLSYIPIQRFQGTIAARPQFAQSYVILSIPTPRQCICSCSSGFWNASRPPETSKDLMAFCRSLTNSRVHHSLRRLALSF